MVQFNFYLEARKWYKEKKEASEGTTSSATETNVSSTSQGTLGDRRGRSPSEVPDWGTRELDYQLEEAPMGTSILRWPQPSSSTDQSARNGSHWNTACTKVEGFPGGMGSTDSICCEPSSPISTRGNELPLRYATSCRWRTHAHSRAWRRNKSRDMKA